MAMNEPKAFASLSSGLLARKGAAKPAMRPQGFGQMGASLEDLGWNDMGFEAPKPSVAPQARDADHDAFGDAVSGQPIRNPIAALTPSPTLGAPASPVHEQQADLAQQFGDDRYLDDATDEGEPDDSEPYESELEDEGEDADEVDEALPAAVAADAFDDAVDPVPTLSVKPRILAAQAAEVAAPVARPVEPEPVAAVAAPVIAMAPVSVRPRAANGAGPKAAFTLRLDAQRHLKLRLACALTGRSAQMMVTEAVDRLLASYPELENIAGQLPEGSRSRRAQG